MVPFIEEVSSEENKKSQSGLANFASPGAGYPFGQLSALPRRKSRLVD
jgi:hypothetical protein